MSQLLHHISPSANSFYGARLCRSLRGIRRLLLLPVLSAALVFAGAPLNAQSPVQITRAVDATQVRALANHLPHWANTTNDHGLVPADLVLDRMTMVLSRAPQQQLAFEKFLAEQQNPASPSYHHWLTPLEMGERFGVSELDIATVTGWLQSQGLHVNSVSTSRIFIGFGGTAADIGHAFQTEMHYYKVNGVERMSVSSDPMIPEALTPVIKAIRGLYTIEDRPFVHARSMLSNSPEMDASGGTHFIVPADFATIYDLPSGLNGTGVTIGIVGRSRTNFADFANFRSLTGSAFANPTEIIPTAYGGADPGPAQTTCNTQTCNPPEDQLEATLDVLRAGSVAPGANILLVVDTSASGDIGADAKYLVDTTPLPAQVMSISFGECESTAGPSGVNFWDPIFSQAAGEGISVYVSSGDAGASGCDTAFAAPPASPSPNSPNYICSSSWATCVGGTEFNDTASPSTYWSANNNTTLGSALSYIPEGGWNEPLNGNSTPTTQAASSGGGVSTVIATPPWQTGTGVPSARTGRYTPDIAFTSSGHDGYFGCFAAAGSSCVVTNGSYNFEYFDGTSAAAPDMAGITALLDQKVGKAQGSLNTQLYKMAASSPAAFHDVTVASSGVSGCSVNTPSMCNNSIPGPGGLTGGQAGFLVGTGYDEVTGLGSLDVATFINDYAAPATATPTVTVTSASTITTSQPLTVTVAVSGGTGSPVPTGSVVLTSGSYTSPSSPLASGSASITIPAGSLAAGTDTLTATYTPDSASSATYNSATGTGSVTVTGSSKATPTVVVTPGATTITTAQQLTVTVAVNGASGSPVPTGSVVLTSGSYTSPSSPLASGSASITVPAGSLTAGTDTLTATYTPDAAGAATYNSATGTGTVTVTAPVSPSFTITGTAVSVAPGATTGNTSTITVTPAGGFSGAVNLSCSISPVAASDPATCSFGSTTPVNITTAAGTGTLTISTTAAATAALAYPRHGRVPWYAAGGAALACILLFGIPARRRSWRIMLGMLMLLVALSGGVLACGGGGSGSSTPPPPPPNPGTTPGTYTVTVTGASGALTATGTVTLTVQ
jgi:subtilase family serine protease